MVRNTLLRGNYCETIVAAKLQERGYTVFLPLGGGGKCDLVVDVRGKLLKIQVKSTVLEQGKERIRLRRQAYIKNIKHKVEYQSEDLDYFIVVSRALQFYIIPFSEANNVHGAGTHILRRTEKYLDAWF